jgi:multisubunit Na+/H+ antiporter MnhC subunit
VVNSIASGSVVVEFSVLPDVAGGRDIALSAVRAAFAQPGITVAGSATTLPIIVWGSSLRSTQTQPVPDEAESSLTAVVVLTAVAGAAAVAVFLCMVVRRRHTVATLSSSSSAACLQVAEARALTCDDSCGDHQSLLTDAPEANPAHVHAQSKGSV